MCNPRNLYYIIFDDILWVHYGIKFLWNNATFYYKWHYLKCLNFSSSHLCLWMDNRRVTCRAKRIVPKPSHVPYSRPAPSGSPASTTDDQNQSAVVF